MESYLNSMENHISYSEYAEKVKYGYIKLPLDNSRCIKNVISSNNNIDLLFSDTPQKQIGHMIHCDPSHITAIKVGILINPMYIDKIKSTAVLGVSRTVVEKTIAIYKKYDVDLNTLPRKLKLLLGIE